MHNKAVHMMGLSNVLREAIACENLTTASASGLGDLHGDGARGGKTRAKRLSRSRSTNKSVSLKA